MTKDKAAMDVEEGNKSRIKSARKMKGLSLRKAAVQLGISHEGLNKFENGKLNPNSSMLLRMSKVFGVSPDYFLKQKRKEVVFTNVQFHRLPKII